MTAGELEHIRQMANQIAANFSFHADQVERICDHMTRFWAPSMRKLIRAYVQQGGEGLEPAVHEAVRLLKSG
jgi:formate dehydrogenase subunit delta